MFTANLDETAPSVIFRHCLFQPSGGTRGRSVTSLCLTGGTGDGLTCGTGLCKALSGCRFETCDAVCLQKLVSPLLSVRVQPKDPALIGPAFAQETQAGKDGARCFVGER